MIGTLQNVILRKNASGVATVLIDCPGKINSLTVEATRDLEQALADVESDPAVKAVIVVSGKPDNFVTGADLREISKLTDKETARSLSSRGQEILDKLASFKKPTVAGINGACLGGGLELTLACDRRIATTDEITVLGLPEVRLGIIPGMGGTQRLPRLIGLQAALELILTGEPISAARALEIGLVDELVDPDELLERCQASVKQLMDDESSRKLAADRKAGPRDPDGAKADKILATAERSTRIRTKGNYPAAVRVVEVIRNGLKNGIGPGQSLEAEVFADLAVTDVAKNLISLFFNTEFARQTAAVMSSRAQSRPVATAGVVGSGPMGIAVAQLAALGGYKVLFRQTNRNPEDKPIERLRASIGHAHHGAKANDIALEDLLARVEPLTTDGALAAADLIIESVYEDENVKSGVFERLEPIVSPECVLATNTSSLSISRLASRLSSNGRFLGMHFFHPPDRMPLVEIICHRGTGRDAIARAASVVSKLGRIPIIVNDGPGFLVNRLLCTYIIEAARLVGMGVPVNWLDEAALKFGMAMSPLVVFDEVGFDVAYKVADAMLEGLGDRFAPPPAMTKTRALGLSGKKTGAGVYSWDENGRRLNVNPSMLSEVGLVVSEQSLPPDEALQISRRLIFPMIDEACRCLEDGIVRKPREIDLAMVLGTGFPAFRGGPLRYADSIGIPRLREALEKQYAEDGSGRRVSDCIRKLESEGRRYYSRSSDA